MNYTLPTSVTISGTEYAIRSDFRAILDIFSALNDVELDDKERCFVAVSIFYPDFGTMPPEHCRDAVIECFKFINGGADENETRKRKKPTRLIDWEQDFPLVVAPVNRVLGCDVRGLEYLHWWTFLAAFQEIGDCTFAQVVRIRSKKAKGQKLDKDDMKWYRENRELVDLKTHYSQAEQALLKEWGM